MSAKDEAKPRAVYTVANRLGLGSEVVDALLREYACPTCHGEMTVHANSGVEACPMCEGRGVRPKG